MTRTFHDTSGNEALELPAQRDAKVPGEPTNGDGAVTGEASRSENGGTPTERMAIIHTQSNHCAQALLEAAGGGARAGDLKQILDVVGAAVTRLSDQLHAGLAVYEPRQRHLVIYGMKPSAESALPAEGEEFPLNSTEAGSFLIQPETYQSPDLQVYSVTPLQQRLAKCGIRKYVSIPLHYGGQLVGAIHVYSTALVAITQSAFDYLEQLGELITPPLWSLLTQDRLVKGDRRRAILVELASAINTSLSLQPVLDAAKLAVEKIEGHCVNVIALLSDDRQHIKAYWHPQERRPAPEILPVSKTALSWVLEHQQTYESKDLSQLRFEMDRALAQAGAKRYVVAPMFVRGRVIGGFFFGTTDPHPALTTDVWLYENIAMQLALAIDNAVQFEQLKQMSERLAEQNVYLREEIESHLNIEGMVGRSAVMQRVSDRIARVASTDSSVLIYGQTGVGKELVARAIHGQSNRAAQPLVKVNCAAIADSLVESELFGHEKGAFTSAVARRIGRFELARDGTLFLDEVGELPLPIQAKLLRVLQDGEFERVGGSETIKTDARIIAATNRDLSQAIERGLFRSDLYYRLNVFQIDVPALAERREDIPLLVESFVAQLSRQMGKRVDSIAPASLEYLCNREWPGNVRELRHVIEQALILCDGPVLVIEPSAPGPQPRNTEPSRLSEREDAGDTDPETLQPLRAMERDHIARTLSSTGGVIEGPRGAATLLGLKPSTLRSRMKRLGISRHHEASN